MMWYQEYLDTYIGFIVKTRHDKFKPIIGQAFESSGDNDCIISVVGSQPPMETIDGALKALNSIETLHKVFKVPNPSGHYMGHWLVGIIINETGIDPRK